MLAHVSGRVAGHQGFDRQARSLDEASLFRREITGATLMRERRATEKVEADVPSRPSTADPKAWGTIFGSRQHRVGECTHGLRVEIRTVGAIQMIMFSVI